MKLLPSSIEMTPEFRSWIDDNGLKLGWSWVTVWTAIFLTAWLLGGSDGIAAYIEGLSMIGIIFGVTGITLGVIWFRQ